MELDNPAIRQPLDRIISAILADRTLLLRTYKTELNSQGITAENLGDLAGNHLFDDDPELFGITEDEGLIVRAYLARVYSSAADLGGSEDFEIYHWVLELHQIYPQVMEEERPEFLEHMNRVRLERRLKRSLKPTSL